MVVRLVFMVGLESVPPFGGDFVNLLHSLWMGLTVGVNQIR